MVAFHYPWGVVVESPSPEGAALFLRGLGEAKLADLSLLADHELLLVDFIIETYPEVASLMVAEVLGRRGLLFTPGNCAAPGDA